MELIFTAPMQWQLRDSGMDIWGDDDSTDPKIRKSGSYVIATAMSWRFL